MTDDLVARLEDYAATGYRPWPGIEQVLSEAAARIEALNSALELALGYLIEDEPGDSRLVSDEFVAMAVVLDGHDATDCLPIIKAAIASRRAALTDARHD